MTAFNGMSRDDRQIQSWNRSQSCDPAILAHWMAGLDTFDIARELSLPEAVVFNRLFHAREEPAPHARVDRPRHGDKLMSALITILHQSASVPVTHLAHTGAARPQLRRRPPIQLEPRPSWWCGMALPICGAVSGAIALLPLAAAIGSFWWLFVPAAYGFIIGCLFHE